MDERLARPERLFAEYQRFMGGWRASLDDVAREFNVSRWTASRDLMALQGAPFRLPVIRQVIYYVFDDAYKPR